jgi:hypothetical protein
MSNSTPPRLFRITATNSASPAQPSETFTDRFGDEAQARDLLRRRGWIVDKISELPVNDEPQVQSNSGASELAKLDPGSLVLLSFGAVFISLAASGYGAMMALVSLIGMMGRASWGGTLALALGTIAYSLVVTPWALVRLAQSNQDDSRPLRARWLALAYSPVMLIVIWSAALSAR